VHSSASCASDTANQSDGHAEELLSVHAVRGDELRGSLIGDPDQIHSYTFTQDAARTLATLGTRDDVLGEVFHVPNPGRNNHPPGHQ
jgi:hypothetical protein